MPLNVGDCFTIGHDPQRFHQFPDGTPFEYIVAAIGENDSLILEMTRETIKKLEHTRNAR